MNSNDNNHKQVEFLHLNTRSISDKKEILNLCDMMKARLAFFHHRRPLSSLMGFSWKGEPQSRRFSCLRKFPIDFGQTTFRTEHIAFCATKQVILLIQNFQNKKALNGRKERLNLRFVLEYKMGSNYLITK